MDTTWGFRRLFRVFWRKLKRLEVQPPWPVTVIGKWKKRKLFLVLKLHRLYHFSGHSENGVVFSGLREEKMWLFFGWYNNSVVLLFFSSFFLYFGGFLNGKVGECVNICGMSAIWRSVGWTWWFYWCVLWWGGESAWGEGEWDLHDIFCDEKSLLKMWLGRSEPHECEPGPWLLKTQFRNFV